MSLIKQIDRRSVHNIQSGQVINDGLTSAVKELVENALDAHATSIEVRFKNYGLDSIEVADNGDGIAPDSYESLALKHYTSKLTTYADLSSVTTFGFRGEALSSLSALSDLSVVTARADDAPKGVKLEFEPSGKLKSQTVTAASKGTTVTVGNLFKTLPVRRKELERNVKREFAKVLGVLQAYAGVCKGVKMNVWNIPSKGKKTIAFATKGNPTTRENISNVFGAKTLTALVALELEFELESTTKGKGVGVVEDGNREVRIVGHISRPVVGEGRNAPDRQMFFVNGRPCVLPQIAKAFNEVYKGYNVTQSPFIFADIQLDTNAYDVNVSPDKRTILLHDQVDLLEKLKASLTELFGKHEQTVPVNQLELTTKLPGFKQPSFTRPKQSSLIASSPAPATLSFPSKISTIQTPQESTPEESDVHSEEERASSPAPRPNRRSASEFTRTTVPISRIMRTTSRGPDDVPSTAPAKASSSRQNQDLKGSARSAFSPTTTADELDEASEDVDDEEPIPSSMLTRVLRSPKVLPTFRSPRKTDAPATITIGDRSPAEVGANQSPPNKRRRVEAGGRGSAAAKPSSFIKSLSKFAAPGTKRSASAIVDDEAEEADEEELELQEEVPTSDVDMDEDHQGPHQDHEEPPTDEDEEEAMREAERPLFAPNAIDLSDSEEEDGPEPEHESIPEPEPEAEEPSVTILDEEYIPDSEIRLRAKQRAAQLLQEAEQASADPTPDIIERASRILRGSEKATTKPFIHTYTTSFAAIAKSSSRLRRTSPPKPLIITRSDDNNPLDLQDAAAEQKLTLTVSKSDFLSMSIKGQFNRGFILATRASELFIIDQHASDEKYNFETLQRTTTVQNQPLVVPRVLDLMAMDELAVMDNLDILKKNGFIVDVDPDEITGRRCRLRSLPMSKETVFGIEDLEELIHLIHSAPGNMHVRCSKIRSMFAMRACRKSVMVGKALPVKQMEKIVRHMGELDKPWNCPHGRPTMRHLAELGSIKIWGEGDEGGCKWDGEWWRALMEGAVEVGEEDEEGQQEEEGGGEMEL